MNFLRKSGTSIEIDSDDLEYECNVLFLWTKKNKTIVDTVKRQTSELSILNWFQNCISFNYFKESYKTYFRFLLHIKEKEREAN